MKDLDCYLEPAHASAAMAALDVAGFVTAVKHPEWLVQAFRADCRVDLVFGMGNWLAPVDAIWVEAAPCAEILGESTRVAPLEELIWSTSFLMSRDRNDAADIYHLINAVEGALDWARLLRRFGEHWAVLLGHLVFFGYVYPGSQRFIPEWPMGELLNRLRHSREASVGEGKVCYGFFLDGAGAYNLDVDELGYRDERAVQWQLRAREGNFPPLMMPRERTADGNQQR